MCNKLSIHLLLYLLLCIGLSSNKCPIWHISRNGQCECCNSFNKIIQCGDNILFVEHGYCLTWNNSTQSAELHRCFFSGWSSNYSLPYAWTGDHMDRIPLDTSRSALDSLSCGEYNRRGTQCRQCIDGYGPALFSDDIFCTDCSKYKHLWVLILLFQLIMLTLMCLVFIILKVNESGSPFNVIIAYGQLIALGFRLSGNMRNKTLCFNFLVKNLLTWLCHY